MDLQLDQFIVLDQVQEIPQGKVFQWGHWYIVEEGSWLNVRTDQVHIKLSDSGIFWFKINGEERRGWGEFELKKPPLYCNLLDTIVGTSLASRKTQDFTLQDLSCKTLVARLTRQKFT